MKRAKNLKKTPSLRGSLSEAKTTKRLCEAPTHTCKSKKNNKLPRFCESQNLAQKFAESKKTPLAPLESQVR
ncbi:hypothetical protein ACWIUD_02530 [Helicobacter sp. 23-1044]